MTNRLRWSLVAAIVLLAGLGGLYSGWRQAAPCGGSSGPTLPEGAVRIDVERTYQDASVTAAQRAAVPAPAIGAAWSLRVVSEDGATLSDIQVGQAAEFDELLDPTRTAADTTDHAGEVRLRSGRPAWVLLSGAGRRSTLLGPLDEAWAPLRGDAADEGGVIETTLAAEGEPTVLRFVDPEGQPVVGARVQLHGAWGRESMARLERGKLRDALCSSSESDATGEVRLFPVASQDRLYVEAPGFLSLRRRCPAGSGATVQLERVLAGGIRSARGAMSLSGPEGLDLDQGLPFHQQQAWQEELARRTGCSDVRWIFGIQLRGAGRRPEVEASLSLPGDGWTELRVPMRPIDELSAGDLVSGPSLQVPSGRLVVQTDPREIGEDWFVQVRGNWKEGSGPRDPAIRRTRLGPDLVRHEFSLPVGEYEIVPAGPLFGRGFVSVPVKVRADRTTSTHSRDWKFTDSRSRVRIDVRDVHGRKLDYFVLQIFGADGLSGSLAWAVDGQDTDELFLRRGVYDVLLHADGYKFGRLNDVVVGDEANEALAARLTPGRNEYVEEGFETARGE